MINRLVFDLDQFGSEIELKKLEVLANTLTAAARVEDIQVLSVTTTTLLEVVERGE